jgi:hypothetical protein
MNRFRNVLILTHRYLGIPLSFVFVVWFLSGIVMMYAGGMPSLAPEARLARLPPLDFARVGLTPLEAVSRAEAVASKVKLLAILGRPAYRFESFGRTTVFADDGSILDPIDVATARTVASRFLEVPENLIDSVSIVSEPDQWTLTLSRELPLYKFRVVDDSATELYVSPALAEVVLVTTGATRALAWAGTIPHWFYVTPLRVDQPVWYWTVVWVSGVGCVLALLGLVLGVLQFRPARPFSFRASIPYRGSMRWHYITGAVFGLFTLTWVFSGLMSMEPFDWTRAEGLEVPRDVFSGGALDLERFPPFDGARLTAALEGRAVKELELLRIQDAPYYLARLASPDASGGPDRQHQPYPLAADAGADEILVDASTLHVRHTPFSVDSLLARLQTALPDTAISSAELVDQYDSYYYARAGRAPLPVLRVKFADPAQTWAYIDPRKGELVGIVHRLSRLERWLFNGLHSLDFAFWWDRRPLWDLGMIVLSLGALVSSGIGMYLGIKRIRRDAAGLWERRQP